MHFILKLQKSLYPAFKGVSVSNCTKMWWKGVPCRWFRVAEAKLAELSFCGAFKVVCCIRRPQNLIPLVLTIDQVHKQAEFEFDSACNWQPVELLQCRRHVVTKTRVEHQTICRVLDSL